MTASPGHHQEPGEPPTSPGTKTAARRATGLAASRAPSSRLAVWTSWRRWAVGVLCVVLLGVAVRAEGPMFSESIRSFAHLRWRPVVWAVAAETASMMALALLERRILIMGGLELRVGRAVAIAYASNALSGRAPGRPSPTVAWCPREPRRRWPAGHSP